MENRFDQAVEMINYFMGLGFNYLDSQDLTLIHFSLSPDQVSEQVKEALEFAVIG
jgi:hypothetical protein